MTRTANAALSREARKALALLARLTAEVNDRALSAGCGVVVANWGEVGDLQKIAADLQEISDYTFGEGEYAVELEEA